MKTPIRPTLLRDPALIHASTRTLMSTNADPAGARPAQISLRVTRLEIRRVDGTFAIRFTAQHMPALPAPRGRRLDGNG